MREDFEYREMKYPSWPENILQENMRHVAIIKDIHRDELRTRAVKNPHNLSRQNAHEEQIEERGIFTSEDIATLETAEVITPEEATKAREVLAALHRFYKRHTRDWNETIMEMIEKVHPLPQVVEEEGTQEEQEDEDTEKSFDPFNEAQGNVSIYDVEDARQDAFEELWTAFQRHKPYVNLTFLQSMRVSLKKLLTNKFAPDSMYSSLEEMTENELLDVSHLAAGSPEAFWANEQHHEILEIIADALPDDKAHMIFLQHAYNEESSIPAPSTEDMMWYFRQRRESIETLQSNEKLVAFRGDTRVKELPVTQN